MYKKPYTTSADEVASQCVSTVPESYLHGRPSKSGEATVEGSGEGTIGRSGEKPVASDESTGASASTQTIFDGNKVIPIDSDHFERFDFAPVDMPTTAAEFENKSVANQVTILWVLVSVGTLAKHWQKLQVKQGSGSAGMSGQGPGSEIYEVTHQLVDGMVDLSDNFAYRKELLEFFPKVPYKEARDLIKVLPTLDKEMLYSQVVGWKKKIDEMEKNCGEDLHYKLGEEANLEVRRALWLYAKELYEKASS